MGNEISNRDKLQALITQWTHLDNLTNSIENKHNSVLFIIITLLGAFCIYYDADKLRSGDYLQITLLFVVPAIALVVFAYTAFLCRFVAVLRGTLSRLEYKINHILGVNDFAWNSEYVPKYISVAEPNKVLPLTFLVASIIILIFLAYQMFFVALTVHMIIKVVYLCVFTWVLLILIFACSRNLMVTEAATTKVSQKDLNESENAYKTIPYDDTSLRAFISWNKEQIKHNFKKKSHQKSKMTIHRLYGLVSQCIPHEHSDI